MKVIDLLESVSFEQAAPFIADMEDGAEIDVHPYQEHYKMLLSLTPQNNVDEICHVVIDYDYIDCKMRVEVYPIAAVEWEYVLGMPVQISDKVNVSRAEIVARCLWQTAKYGFTREQMAATLDTIRRDLNRWKRGKGRFTKKR